MLATLSREIPEGPAWIFEEKYDGIRALAVQRHGRARLYSRSLRDLTPEFAGVAPDVAALSDGSMVLDGELVALDRHGVSRFQLLQRRGEAGVPVRYAIFDLLEDDGRSLLKRPLRERRAALERVLARGRGTLTLARRVGRDGERALAIAKRRGWEGVVAKDESSVYEPGARSRAWLKLKVRQESEFVIGGYTPPQGSRLHLGALLVGLHDGARLRYCGKVGTGYAVATLRDLAARLAPLRTGRPPFDPPPRVRLVTWARPRLVAQIAFAEWTADGKLRQPAFLGLRTDKDPRECRWDERER